MKKALFLVNSLSGGGAEKVCINMAKELVNQGYNAEFITLYNEERSESVCKFKIHCMNINKEDNKYLRVIRILLSTIKINKFINDSEEKEGNYELITSHLPLSHMLTRMLSIKSRAIYVIHNMHYNLDKKNSKLFSFGMKLLYKNRKVVAVSNGVREELINKYKLNEDDVNIIYNPINFDEINSKKDEILNVDYKYFLSVGRLDDIKRPDRIIDVFYQGNFYKGYKLVFVGQGILKDMLERKAIGLGIENSIIFAGWQDNVYNWMKNAELLISTSSSESLGMNLIESLACGTAVISSDCHCGPREILIDEYSNFLVKEDDIEGYVEKINLALSLYPRNPDKILEKFKASSIIDRYIGFYNNSIKIMTIQCAHNYGSVLQAYGLQETLKKYSNDVKIINYRPKYFEEVYKLFSIKVYKHYSSSINNVLKHFVGRTLLFPIRLVKYIKFENYMKKRYSLTRRYSSYKDLLKNVPLASTYFCGSDQIWNTDITSGFDYSYYLNFAKQGSIKASYAASLAKKDIDRKYEKEYGECISKFDYISLREETSKDAIQVYTDKEVKIVLDPTLLVNRRKWTELAMQSKLKIKEKYILVYMLEDNQELINIVNELSDKTGYIVISLNKLKKFKNEKHRFSWAGPEDFLKLFMNSEIVVTNSFHGVVFSILFEKKNYAIPHKTRGNRIVDLLSKLGLQSRILYTVQDLNHEVINETIDYSKVKGILDDEINKSLKYIEDVLERK